MASVSEVGKNRYTERAAQKLKQSERPWQTQKISPAKPSMLNAKRKDKNDNNNSNDNNDKKYEKKPEEKEAHSYQGDELRQAIAKMFDDIIMKKFMPTFIQFCKLVPVTYKLIDRTDENSSTATKRFVFFAGILGAVVTTPLTALVAMGLVAKEEFRNPWHVVKDIAEGFKKTGFKLPPKHNRDLEEVKPEGVNKQSQDSREDKTEQSSNQEDVKGHYTPK